VKAVRILAEVAADVAEAARWYDEEGHLGLGDRFVDTFYSCVSIFRSMGRYIGLSSRISAESCSGLFPMRFTTATMMN